MTGILLPSALNQVERQLLHRALQPKQRRDMGLERDAPAEVQQLVKRLAEQLVRRLARAIRTAGG